MLGRGVRRTTGPVSCGTAFRDPVVEPHQLPVAHRDQCGKIESGGRPREGDARVWAATGAGTVVWNAFLFFVALCSLRHLARPPPAGEPVYFFTYVIFSVFRWVFLSFLFSVFVIIFFFHSPPTCTLI